MKFTTIRWLLIFAVGTLSAQSLHDYQNLNDFKTVKTTNNVSIFAALSVEPLIVDSVVIDRTKLTIEINDTSTIISVSRKIDVYTIGIPMVMQREAYQQMMIDFVTAEQIKVKTKEKLAADVGNANLFGNFKFGTNLQSETMANLFGSSEVSIQINGNIEIDIGGKTTAREGSFTSARDESEGALSPKLDLKQRFFLEGKIGDKLTIEAQQDSEADLDIENVIKIKYKGYDDEIVQSIEAGNIDLRLPGSTLISNTETHKGLFGVKTELKLGDLSFTGIASLQRGEKQRIKYNNGRQTSNDQGLDGSRTYRDYDYVKYQFFFVDTIFRNNFEIYSNPQNFPIRNNEIENAGRIVQLNVFVSTNNNDDVSIKRYATAVTNKDLIAQVDSTRSKAGIYETSGFKQLTEGVDYGYDALRGFFWLKRAYDDRSVAIYYQVDYTDQTSNINNTFWMNPDVFNQYDKETDYLTFRNTAATPAKYLKLVKSLNQKKTRTNDPSYALLERLHMKNVYYFGYRRNENVKVTIYRDNVNNIGPEAPYEELNYLNIFAMDQLNAAGTEVANDHRGDGVLDFNNLSLFESPTAQYLIFPFLQPFEPSNTAQQLMRQIKLRNGSEFVWDSTFTSQDIYSYSNAVLQQTYEIRLEGDQGTGVAGTGGGSTNEYQLGFGVLEGSERVVINGETMKRGIDYDINYFTGTLVLKSNKAIANQENIDIEFEKSSLFQLDKRTLFGARLEYTFDPRTFIGATALYLNKSSLDEKVVIGQEPFENFMWGINGAVETEIEALTDAVNWLPGVATTAESRLRFSAEFAQLLPNPNTRNNEKTGDNNGVAYLDDFEAAKRISGIAMNRVTWVPASNPKILNGMSNISAVLADSGRAQMAFFNPFRRYRSTLILDREVSSNVLDEIQILNMAIRKETKIYNNTGQVIEAENVPGQPEFKRRTPRQNAWAGIMASNKHNSDLNNTRFLEVWVRWDVPRKNNVLPYLNIDFGSISEDYYTDAQVNDGLASFYLDRGNTFPVVPGRNLKSTEDIAGGFEDQFLQEEEDVGLDRMSDTEEAIYYGRSNPYDNWEPLVVDAQERSFAANDSTILVADGDFTDYLKSIIPWRINGTDGNSRESGYNLYPDKEDVDNDGLFETEDNYFHVEIPMHMDLQEVQQHPYFSAIGKEQDLRWVQFRIPIRELVEEQKYFPESTVPNLSNIDFIRVYVDRFDALDDDDVIMVNFAAIDFVSTDWQTLVPKDVDDIVFSNTDIGVETDEIGVRFLNSDENQNTLNPDNYFADYYVSPPGAEGDFIDAERTTRGKEQALVLDINDLKAGQRAEVYKSAQFIASNLSLHNYKKIRFFMRSQRLDINDDDPLYELPESIDEFKADGAHRNYFYLKFGQDSRNFYEYRVPIITNRLPDEFSQPDADSKAIQRAYWNDTKVEIDLDAFAAVKTKGFVERFGAGFNAFYLPLDPNEPLLDQYRVVGNPNLNNLKYMMMGVYNADDKEFKNRPLTTQIWVNELRVTDVRKEPVTAMRMSVSANFADVATMTANFSNREAGFHAIHENNKSGAGQTTVESQQLNMDVKLNRFLPSSLNLQLPVIMNYTNSISIPKYRPGTDILTFYNAGDILDKVVHMLGFGNYGSDIQSIYSLTRNRKISFSARKGFSEKFWLYDYLLDRFSYNTSYSVNESSNNIYSLQESRKINHSFNYNLPFPKDNFFQPLSWLGKGGFVDRFSQIRVYYTPTSISGGINFDQTDTERQKRGVAPDEPVLTANSNRKVSVKYALTDEINASIDRNYTADISQVIKPDSSQMTIFDAMKNMVLRPFTKNAVGNDTRITNSFQVGFTPRLFQALTFSFQYGSQFSYVENVANNYATFQNSKSFNYKVGMRPATAFKDIFGIGGTTQSTPSGGRGRGRGRRQTPTEDGGQNQFNPFAGSGQSAFYFQQDRRGLQFDLNWLNPLNWGEALLTGWDRFDIAYQRDFNIASDLHEQKLPGWGYQLGFSSMPDIARVDSIIKIGETEVNKISLKNAFRLNRNLTVSLENDYTQNRRLADISNNNAYTKEYSFFSPSEQLDVFRDFRSSDSLNTTPNLGFLVPNWSVTLKGLENWPVIDLIAKTAEIRHARRGKVKSTYTDNAITSNPIERYQFEISNEYSPLVGFRMTTDFSMNIDVSYGFSEKLSLTSASTGIRATTDRFSFTATYRTDGGFRIPFDFWPFNNAYIKNSINFSFKLTQTESNNDNYKRDLFGQSVFSNGSFSRLFSLEPSMSYQFSNTITGSLFYKYNTTENTRIRRTTYNEFGIKINMTIRN